MKRRISLSLHGNSRCGAVLTGLLLWLSGVNCLLADWTATGTFQYTDRTYNGSGYTGTAPMPVRTADVEIFDTTTQVVLAQGATAANGSFSIVVTDSSTRNVGVRTLASTTQTAVIDFSVVDDLNGDAVFSYHDASTDVAAHTPAADVAFSTMTMPAAIGPVATTDWSSQIFNTLDMCILTADWIATVDGALPSQSLSVGWNPTSGATGSNYSSGTNRFNMSDDDAYDDPNIIHEIGHWVEDEFGRSRNPGGSHTLPDNDQDPRLAWSEGFATLVNGAVLHHHALPFPNIYMDRDSFGAAGSGFNYDYEVQQSGGSASEVAVNAALYDIVDDSSSADGTPGTDDDPMSGGAANVWKVLEEMRVMDLPATSLEDFWDLWFELSLGSSANMETVFSSHQIDFAEDSSEPNNLRTTATALTSSFVEHTFYQSGAEPGGDEDWFQFSAVADTYYSIEVNGAANQIFGRPDPEIYLLDGNSNLLAYNDDPHDTSLNTATSNNDTGETAPEILWRAPASGTFYVYCRHGSYRRNLGGRYGTYQIRVTTAGSPTPTIATVAAQQMLPGQSYQILIIGDDMAVGATVTDNSADVTVTETDWIAPQAIVATLAVDSAATAGTVMLTVSNPGAGSAMEASAITISASAKPPLVMTEVMPISIDLNQVEIKNLGSVSADLTGWQITGQGYLPQSVFTFPSFTLASGATVRVSDSTGTDTATALFEQATGFGWPWHFSVSGDVSLLDAGGRNVDYLRWISSYAATQTAPVGTGAAWMQPEILNIPFTGFTNVSLSRSDSSFTRTTRGVSTAANTMPAGSSGRTNAVDAFEDNDTPRRAPIVSLPADLTGLEISTRPAQLDTDEDWFGFPVLAGDALAISASFSHASGDLSMEVYAPGEESTPLASSATSSDDETVALSAASTTAEGSGIYRVRIFGVGGATNTYQLSILPPQAQINVTGNGMTIPDGDITPASTDHTDFGSVDVVTGTITRTFTIENPGIEVLNLTGNPLVAITGTNQDDFTVTQQSPATIAAAGSATFDVEFDPVGTGARQATVEIANNVAGMNPYDFAIAGTATGTAPVTVTINQTGGQADPTGSSPINFTAIFSESVTGFATGDVNLVGTAGATTAIVTEIAPNNGTTFHVAAIGMTGSGTVTVSIAADVATNGMGTGNTASTSTDNTVTFNDTELLPDLAPFVPAGWDDSLVISNQTGTNTDDAIITDLDNVIVDLAYHNIGTATAFANSHIARLTLDGVSSFGDIATGFDVDPFTTIAQIVDANLGPLAPGSHTIIWAVDFYDALAEKDEANNIRTRTFTVFDSTDVTNSTVTINQAAGQSDPTGDAPIHFTAVFDEPVFGFATGDVALGGAAGATTDVVIEIAPNDGTTYDVAVSGMTDDGTVIASIAAGVATDALGNNNDASTSTDPQVSFTGNTVVTVTGFSGTTVSLRISKILAGIRYIIRSKTKREDMWSTLHTIDNVLTEQVDFDWDHENIDPMETRRFYQLIIELDVP
ncbi:MAG: hypothetical protein ACI9R3_004497 [Verrucomicrobiales bacterium]|jgi:hypothetical protein